MFVRRCAWARSQRSPLTRSYRTKPNSYRVSIKSRDPVILFCAMANMGANSVPGVDKPDNTGDSSQLQYAEIKEQIWRGLCDFKNVFLYPLCTGIMTGVGFMAGKKIGERYFYGAQKSA